MGKLNFDEIRESGKKASDEGVWVNVPLYVLDPDEKEDWAVSVRIRFYTPSVREKHNRRASKEIALRGGFRKLKPGNWVDTDLLTRLQLESILLDWKGITEKQGHPLPCTEENKLAFSALFPRFLDWLVETASEMADLRRQMQEEEAKNSKTGSGGGSPTPASIATPASGGVNA